MQRYSHYYNKATSCSSLEHSLKLVGQIIFQPKRKVVRQHPVVLISFVLSVKEAQKKGPRNSKMRQLDSVSTVIKANPRRQKWDRIKTICESRGQTEVWAASWWQDVGLKTAGAPDVVTKMALFGSNFAWKYSEDNIARAQPREWPGIWSATSSAKTLFSSNLLLQKTHEFRLYCTEQRYKARACFKLIQKRWLADFQIQSSLEPRKKTKQCKVFFPVRFGSSANLKRWQPRGKALCASCWYEKFSALKLSWHRNWN